MYRIIIYPAVLLVSFYFISCAPSSTTQKTDTDASATGTGPYPEWYDDSEAVTENDSLILTYGTALAGDVDVAKEKSAAVAKDRLHSAISEQIENIRSETSDDDSALDSPAFILSLRKAEKAAAESASESRSDVEEVGDYDSYRGFSEVTITKEGLLEEIENRLTAYQNAWNALKASQAFDDF